MADNDLMIEIMEPVTIGEYQLEWVTVVENDPSTYSGVFNFTVLNRWKLATVLATKRTEPQGNGAQKRNQLVWKSLLTLCFRYII